MKFDADLSVELCKLKHRLNVMVIYEITKRYSRVYRLSHNIPVRMDQWQMANKDISDSNTACLRAWCGVEWCGVLWCGVRRCVRACMRACVLQWVRALFRAI